MKSQEAKAAMIDALDEMIRHADKGPSGFWIGDGEGCGNPAVFPEFYAGLKARRSVRKEHSLCPWNTMVLYGGQGNAGSGCYYSCSIKKARYLPEPELREVLLRFKTRLESGDYEKVSGTFPPLLTPSEKSLIETRIRTEQEARKRREDSLRKERLARAAALIEKYPDKEDLFGANYGEKILVSTYEDGYRGTIDFDPEGYLNVAGAEKFTYDDYLDVQLRSLGHCRMDFAACFFNCPINFKGRIEKISKGRVCFQMVFVEGMYSDGRMFSGKEDHVWMDQAGFEDLRVGDCVSFFAEVYRYIKTGNGKFIDYGLQNPGNVEKIEDYALPSDEELQAQALAMAFCDNCYLDEYCPKVSCLLAPPRRKRKRNTDRGEGQP